MKNWFIRDRRLRSGWRVLTYVIVSKLAFIMVAILIGSAAALILLSQGVPPNELPERLTVMLSSPDALTVQELVLLPITLGIIYLWRRWLDKKSFRSLGVQLAAGWWRELVAGMALVLVFWSAIFLFSVATSVIVVRAIQSNALVLFGGLSLGLFTNLLVGLNEELDARGYVLQNLREGVGLAPAVVISAIYFGALHSLNPGANLASFWGVTLFGVTAALAYWATGRLWLPIGIHAAWNFFEGPVFGFPVSGLNLSGLFDVRVSGPDWLTGGAFGPEAGLLTVVPQFVLIVLLYLWGKQRRMTVDEKT